jgi:hypothetical protein
MVSGETAGLKIKPAFGAWIMRMFRYKWNANTIHGDNPHIRVSYTP